MITCTAAVSALRIASAVAVDTLVNTMLVHYSAGIG
jgi:hypothetical protein